MLLAGGSGTRLRGGGDGENKVYLRVGGRPMVSWSLDLFQSSPLVDDVVLVIRAADAGLAPPIPKLRATVEGGPTRQDSELAGLQALAGAIESGEVGLVLIHDAARPFVSADLLTRVLRAARAVGGAVPGLPFAAPVFRAAAGGLERVAVDDVRRMQTPQAFRSRELLAAYRAAARAGFAGADTAECVQRYSDLDVAVVAGDPRNLKVTYPEDLAAAGRLASDRSDPPRSS